MATRTTTPRPTRLSRYQSTSRRYHVVRPWRPRFRSFSPKSTSRAKSTARSHKVLARPRVAATHRSTKTSSPSADCASPGRSPRRSDDVAAVPPVSITPRTLLGTCCCRVPLGGHNSRVTTAARSSSSVTTAAPQLSLYRLQNVYRSSSSR